MTSERNARKPLPSGASSQKWVDFDFKPEFSRNHYTRERAAEAFAELLQTHLDEASRSKEPTGAIALCGAWGSGKTSFVDLAIKKLTTSDEWNSSQKKGVDSKGVERVSIRCDGPRILYFNPWMVEDKTQLVLEFFKQLYGKFPLSDRKGDIGRAFITYATLVAAPVSSFAKVGIQVAAGDPFGVAKAGSEALSLKDKLKGWLRNGMPTKKSDTWDADSLSRAKKELSKVLAKDNVKSRLVIIDNIDRLPDDEIRTVIRLVGTVLDLPRIVYLLVYDYEVVASALRDFQSSASGGEAYLVKIVNTTLRLPPLDMITLAEEFLNKRMIRNPDRARAKAYAPFVAALVHTPRYLAQVDSEMLSCTIFEHHEEVTIELFVNKYLEDNYPKVHRALIDLPRNGDERNMLDRTISVLSQYPYPTSRREESESTASSSNTDSSTDLALRSDKAEIKRSNSVPFYPEDKLLEWIEFFLSRCGLLEEKDSAAEVKKAARKLLQELESFESNIMECIKENWRTQMSDPMKVLVALALKLDATSDKSIYVDSEHYD